MSFPMISTTLPAEVPYGATAYGGMDDFIWGNANALVGGSEAAGLEAIGIDTSILTADEIATLAVLLLV